MDSKAVNLVVPQRGAGQHWACGARGRWWRGCDRLPSVRWLPSLDSSRDRWPP